MSRCPIPAQKIRPETRDPFAGSPPSDRPVAESLACPSPVSLGSGAHIIRFCTSGFQHNPHPPPVWSRPTQSKYHQYYRCGSGGTGRRARLRILWPKGRGGTTPLSRTNFPFQNLALSFMKTSTFWSAGACSRFWDGQTFCPNVHVVAPLQPQKRRRAAALQALTLAFRTKRVKKYKSERVQVYKSKRVITYEFESHFEGSEVFRRSPHFPGGTAPDGRPLENHANSPFLNRQSAGQSYPPGRTVRRFEHRRRV